MNAEKLIHKLSWNKTNFLSKLLLLVVSVFNRKIWSKNETVRAEGLLSLASTCHSITGTAMRQINKRVREVALATILLAVVAKWVDDSLVTEAVMAIFIFRWFLLGGLCYFSSLPLARKSIEQLGGLATAKQLEVYQSILVAHRQYNKALAIIEEAFRRSPQKHTEGLLCASSAVIFSKTDDSFSARGSIYDAMEIASEIRDSQPEQAFRIFRKCRQVADAINSQSYVKVDEKVFEGWDAESAPKDQKLKS